MAAEGEQSVSARRNSAPPARAPRRPPGAGTAQVPRKGPGFGEVLGDICWLMAQSPSHKHMFLADLEWLIIPALTAKQFRVLKADNKPMAYVSWAFLSEEAEARLLSGQRRLRPADWKSGDRLWVVDLVAPFGGREEVLRNLKEQNFAEQKISALRSRADGKGFEAWELGLGG